MTDGLHGGFSGWAAVPSVLVYYLTITQNSGFSSLDANFTAALHSNWQLQREEVPMLRSFWFSLLFAMPVLALAAAPTLPPDEHPVLRDIVNAISAERLQAVDAKLVGFGTRHTLSDTRSNTRGIGAARRWVRAQFEEISKQCGGCLEIITPSRVFTGERTPKGGVEVMDIVAIQKGSTDSNRYLVMTAHLDSRVSDIMNVNAEEPGADDDGSGIAAILETARILSRYKFPASIVYSADSGEEQGLYGGQVIADYARDHHWQVEADLNNDMIGNTHGSDGVVDNTTARIFSEAVKQSLTPKQLNTLRYTGGFVDSPSREVARYVTRLADQYIPNFHFMLMYRQDDRRQCHRACVHGLGTGAADRCRYQG
jgi:hypothetical protein